MTGGTVPIQDRWLFRQNARRLMVFGVHEVYALARTPGVSYLRHYAVNNSDMAKAMVRDNIECLKLMRTERFLNHIKFNNLQTAPYYLAQRALRQRR